MNPRLRKAVPFLAPLLLGAVAYLAIGQGPSSSPVRDGDAASWELPTIAATDTASAAPVWSARAPWGSAVEAVDATPQVALRPVGVIKEGDDLFALFTQGDAVVRVAQGGSLADGGQVTAIRADVVEWVDGAGATQKRELMVDVVEAVAAAAAPTGARARGAARERNRSAPERANRPTRTSPAREAGQRRARSTVQDPRSEQFQNRRPSSTGG